MEEINLKDNIVFNSFDDPSKMKIKILDFIKNSKTDKILYKGDPLEINYKLLKKVLPEKENNIIKELNLDEENLRIAFEKFINKIKSKHCLIYKK
jgi:hypothetical protein